MKKITLFALACVVAMGQAVVAQETSKEVTYVPDETQGYLFNRFKDNWFISAEGGAAMYLSSHDSELKFQNRLTGAGSLYVGKWFSPIFGGRIGVNVMALKGLAETPEVVGGRYHQRVGDFYYQKTIEVGPVADVMVNLTNWWCGYNPTRVYNATVYGGGGFYWTLARKQDQGTDNSWSNTNNKVFTLRCGLINDFRLNEHINLFLDLRWSAFSGLDEVIKTINNKKTSAVQAYLGFTYKFKNNEWKAPVVPVFPEPENCDALRARLAAADARIADLEAQLRDCLNRPVEKVEAKGPVATIYYPIGVSRLTREDRNILGAISNVMKSNPNQHYLLTGWADNYTGTEQINVRLRHKRVEGVAKELKKNGVAESQITATINNGSLCDLGEKYVALDRAVTIEEVK